MPTRRPAVAAIRRLPAHSFSCRTRRQSGRGGSGRSAARLVGRSGLATDCGPHRLHRGRQRPAGRGALPGVHLARGPQGRHRRAAPRHPRGRRGRRHRRPRRAGRVLPGIRHPARRRPGRQPGDGPGREEGSRRCRHRRGRGRPDDRLPGQRRPQQRLDRLQQAPGSRYLAAATQRRHGPALARFRQAGCGRPTRGTRRPRPAYQRGLRRRLRRGASRRSGRLAGDGAQRRADRDRPVLLGQPGLDLPHGVVPTCSTGADGAAPDHQDVRPDRCRGCQLLHPDLAAQVRGRLLATVPGDRGNRARQPAPPHQPGSRSSPTLPTPTTPAGTPRRPHRSPRWCVRRSATTRGWS